jgi:hypothetical protein
MSIIEGVTFTRRGLAAGRRDSVYVGQGSHIPKLNPLDRDPLDYIDEVDKAKQGYIC